MMWKQAGHAHGFSDMTVQLCATPSFLLTSGIQVLRRGIFDPAMNSAESMLSSGSAMPAAIKATGRYVPPIAPENSAVKLSF